MLDWRVYAQCVHSAAACYVWIRLTMYCFVRARLYRLYLCTVLPLAFLVALELSTMCNALG